MQPNNPSVQLTRATVLARLKRTEDALQILAEPDATEPLSWRATQTYGQN